MSIGGDALNARSNDSVAGDTALQHVVNDVATVL